VGTSHLNKAEVKNMNDLLRKLFQPVLQIFESGEGEYSYKQSHRTILIIVGVLFLVLASVSAVAAISASQMGGFFPVLIFFLIGFVCEVVGLLGNERAVAKIWGNK